MVESREQNDADRGEIELTSLVSPLSLDEFLQKVHTRHPDQFRQTGRSFGHLISWGTLNQILRFQRLDWPRLRLADGGRPVPVEDYSEEVQRRNGPPYRRLLPEALLRKARAGATIALDNVDQLHEPLDRLAFALERAFGADVFINLYASWGPQFGFDVHWDDHDVIVLQVSGQKRWKIWEPTRSWPLYRDIATGPLPDGPPIRDFVLHEGDVGYVPRGWWHVAQADLGPSLHVTVGVNTPTVMDLVRWAVDSLLAEDVARMPLLQYCESESYGSMEAVGQIVSAKLADPKLLDEYFLWSAEHSRRHTGFSLPFGLPAEAGGNLTVKLLYPRATLGRADNCTILGAAGKRWKFASKATPILERILSGHELSLGDLTSGLGLPRQQALAVVRVLVEGGVVAVSG